MIHLQLIRNEITSRNMPASSINEGQKPRTDDSKKWRRVREHRWKPYFHNDRIQFSEN